jgi:hypothetical protein
MIIDDDSPASVTDHSVLVGALEQGLSPDFLTPRQGVDSAPGGKTERFSKS